ncbi:hypothetical protein F5141DRAFT_1101381 [Pisolithus sp. B1]|nr:hypothetical protein F5141DRAFT_1101381 [Pisolithus sp. B1]
MEPIRQQDNSQKDLLASLFPELTGDSHRPALDAHQTTLNSGLIQGQRTPNLQLSSSVPFNPPMDLLAMSNLVSVHSMDPNHQNLPSASTFTPQILLEQQYKLTQLHQLQQLQSQIQNQIFQQQVSDSPLILLRYPSPSAWVLLNHRPSPSLRLSADRRRLLLTIPTQKFSVNKSHRPHLMAFPLLVNTLLYFCFFLASQR